MDIGKIRSFKTFKREIKDILKLKLENFLASKVSFYEYPCTQIYEKYSIDITKEPLRGVYCLNNDNALILPRIFSNKQIIAYMGIVLSKKNISSDHKILNVLDFALSRNLSIAYTLNFNFSIQYFDDNLIKLVIANYFSKGYYKPCRIINLINYFYNLRTTSFEGNYFSTGLIITPSTYAYKNYDNGRNGESHRLIKPYIIEGQKIDRRFWYLIDGQHSYYLCSKALEITHVFTIKRNEDELHYINNLTLKDSLRGGDVLFRIENEKSLSIITSNGAEFCFLENQWKYRNYNYIKELICSLIKMNDEQYKYLIYFVLNCSKNNISSILWLPTNIKDIDSILKSKNRLFSNDINISQSNYSTLIKRFLSSDGATIIDVNGYIRYFGCIVDMTKVKIKGIKGTGESAASVLAENGISFKISQDGTIKLYYSLEEEPIFL